MEEYINKWLGIVILAVLAGALMPTVFEYVVNLSQISGLPSAVGTLFAILLPLALAVGLFYAFWKLSGIHGGKKRWKPLLYVMIQNPWLVYCGTLIFLYSLH